MRKNNKKNKKYSSSIKTLEGDKNTQSRYLTDPEDQVISLLSPAIKRSSDLEDFVTLANFLLENGKYAVAGFIYSEWAKREPKNVDAWNCLGVSLIRQRRIQEAKDVLVYAAELNPNHPTVFINLAGVYQALGDYQSSLKVSLDAVRLNPKAALAFNNLSSAFADLGMLEQALHACETALILEPSNNYAKINKLKLGIRLGRYQYSIEEMEAMLQAEVAHDGQYADLLRYHLAFEYLARGRIEEGFHFYESGLAASIPLGMARQPARVFDVPRWDGSQLSSDKTLLVWREQGIGDEIMFGTCLRELEGLDVKIILETDPRLVKTFQRSFPKFLVRAQAFLPEHRFVAVHSDYNYHLPIGSLAYFFRKDLASFSRGTAPYLSPDWSLVQKYRDRLSNYGSKKLIGISWRSGMINSVRNAAYTHLSDWHDLLTSEKYYFVNLQYGDCESELVEAERELGIEIIRWSDLNLKDDLDDVFALMSCLDIVVSVATAVFPMAAAVGTPAIQLNGGHWANFGQPEVYPWFSNAIITGWNGPDPLAAELRKVPGLIDRLLTQH